MQKLADAYGPGPLSSISIPSSPGRWVRFRAGHAPLINKADVLAALRREGVIVDIGPDQVDWVQEWLDAAGEVKAEVQMPSGFKVVNGTVCREVVAEEASWDPDANAKRPRGRPRKESEL